MTPRRWQWIGGFVMGLIYMWIAWTFLNGDWTNIWAWIVTLAAGVLGNAVGEWAVKSWQKAGESDEI